VGLRRCEAPTSRDRKKIRVVKRALIKTKRGGTGETASKIRAEIIGMPAQEEIVVLKNNEQENS